jgi:hypothetical protein
MKSDSKQHNDTFEFFPLYGAGFGQLFPFLVTCRKIDSEPKAIAMLLFVFTRKGNFRQPVLFKSLTPFSFFPPFALFLAPQN